MTLPHIEEGVYTHYIPPKGEYITFLDDAHYEEKVREWGLSKSKDVKKEFWYKTSDYKRIITIAGYEQYGVTGNTIVVQFKSGELSCIHPDYLKEMQSPSFEKKGRSAEVKPEQTEETVELKTVKSVQEPSATKPKVEAKKEKKATAPKIDLPLEKVHFTAKIKQFASSWNHFAEKNDTVIIFEDVKIESETETEVGLAWCSYSKTLEKQELSVGDELSFDGKIVKKTVPKGKDVEDETMLLEVPVYFKINNPSKIKKQ
ncbi:hypothetical protein IEO70_06000 [Bacillus sp. AGMB 02131]|uniref:Uncharacterized protein n=1 Tax=Peribacillus faecalis TaxID=2772559 RepID=A0A927CU78_9BACI|nr:hypothetical protein [Peribacillus faecalis]MBD3107913.1 hypothetical protein [Peribacillus faecalis]